MTGTEIYKRTATYEAEARTIRIHAPQWKVLLAYDGHRTLSEVALAADAAFADAVTLTQKFLEKDWIAEEPISLDQYLNRVGAKDISTAGAVVAPAVVLHDPEKEKPAAPPAATPVPKATVPVAVTPATAPVPVPVTPPPTAVAPQPKVLPPIAPVQPPILPPVVAAQPPVRPVPVAAQPPIAPPTPINPPAIVTPPPLPIAPPTKTTPVTVAPAPVVEKAPVKRVMKLAAVVDYIASLVGNISLGQILVYRVFLRVPPELLLAEDIASVHLSGDTSTITGDKLQKAIADAVHAVAKKALPDSVFAAA
jgi:hypothetical protein